MVKINLSSSKEVIWLIINSWKQVCPLERLKRSMWLEIHKVRGFLVLLFLRLLKDRYAFNILIISYSAPLSLFRKVYLIAVINVHKELFDLKICLRHHAFRGYRDSTRSATLKYRRVPSNLKPWSRYGYSNCVFGAVGY